MRQTHRLVLFARCAIVSFGIAYKDIKLSAKMMLIFEGVSIVFILILGVIIWVQKGFAIPPSETSADFLPAFVVAVNSAGQWATDKPSEVAAYLAKAVGMDPQTLEPIIRREPWGFRPVDAGVIADQQAIADLFYSLKLLPKPIKVSEAVAATPAGAAN